nr:RHS repeat-associated core domain-containing protein [uncultured Shewanella sp.]
MSDGLSNKPERQYLEQAANDPVSCDIRYQGQVYDNETGLYYNRHRYYDPDSCQYLTPDPIGMAGGLRPSAYVHNPMEWVDPLGLAGCPKNETTRVRHYTKKSSANKIMESGEITSKDHGRVYVESANKKALSPKKAESVHKIKPGKGNSYIETDVPTSNIEMIKNPLTGKQEMTIKGTVKLNNAEVIHRRG